MADTTTVLIRTSNDGIVALSRDVIAHFSSIMSMDLDLAEGADAVPLDFSYCGVTTEQLQALANLVTTPPGNYAWMAAMTFRDVFSLTVSADRMGLSSTYLKILARSVISRLLGKTKEEMRVMLGVKEGGDFDNEEERLLIDMEETWVSRCLDSQQQNL